MANDGDFAQNFHFQFIFLVELRCIPCSIWKLNCLKRHQRFRGIDSLSKMDQKGASKGAWLKWKFRSKLIQIMKQLMALEGENGDKDEQKNCEKTCNKKSKRKRRHRWAGTQLKNCNKKSKRNGNKTETQMSRHIVKKLRQINQMKWRCGVSIPVPLAC